MDSPDRMFAPIDIESLYQRRRCARHKLDGPVTQIEGPDRRGVVATVRDVSVNGFMIECGVAIAIGSEVSLEIPGIGPVKAQVRWQIGPRIGGMFIDPISLAECAWTAPGPA